MRKIITLALFIGCCLTLYAQDRKLSISLKKQPITMLLNEIQSQCRYRFLYSNEVVPDTMRVSVEAINKPVSEVLNDVLPAKQLFYQVISNRLIAIGRLDKRENDREEKQIIKGMLSDNDGQPIPFASIGLLEANVLRSGTVSDKNGNYTLAYNFRLQQPYVLEISSVGYRPFRLSFTYPDTSSIKRIVLEEDRQLLKTVNVIAERPMVERRTDRYIVNVEGSVLANGLDGLEVLQKSPGIWVDNDGAIKIKGNQSVMVMINDIVQRMSASDLAAYLRTIRSEDISKIEIISSPPSEFEAAGSGGIIHILLKKTRKDGLVGSLSTQYRQQVNRPAYRAGLSLNYKFRNLYLSGSISGGKDESDYIATNRIRYPNADYYASNTDRYNNNGQFMYRLAAAYDLGKNQSLGLQSVKTASKMNQYFDTYINFMGAQPLTGAAHSEWYRKPSLNGTTLNYVLKTDTLGSTVKVIGDYVYSARTETNDFSSVYTYSPKNSTYRNNTPNKTSLYSLQSDYTQVLKRSFNFKAGLKFVATKRDNEVLNENLIGGVWEVNPQLSNRFLYRENLSMAYASLEKSWGKLSIKGGLRLEHTHMNGNSVTSNDQFTRNYMGLFPSVFISQKLNEEKGSAVYLSYSRRLQRPSFADLNPYRLQFDNYLTQLGNPGLTPEYTHKVEAGTIFGKGFSVDLYYALTTDKIAQLANPVAENIIEYQNRNFNSSYEYGFAVEAPVKLFKWWNTRTSLSGYYLNFSLTDYQINQSTFYIGHQQSITVKNWFDFDLNGYYRSPYVNANTHVAQQFYSAVGLTRRFFDKALQLRLQATDIFNTAREKDYTEYGNTRIDFYQKRPTRVFSLSLNYTFSSGKKFKNKNIEQSNDEEKRRIGN